MGEAKAGDTCTVDDCPAVCFLPFPKCFAHLIAQARAQALRYLGPGSEVDLRRTTLTTDLVAEVLDAVRDDEGTPTFGTANFAGARFPDSAHFDQVAFGGPVTFDAAVFARELELGDTRMTAGGSGLISSGGPLKFDRAVFESGLSLDADAPEVSFVNARFEGPVVLRLQRANVWLDAATLSDTMTVVSSDIRPESGLLEVHEREQVLGTARHAS